MNKKNERSPIRSCAHFLCLRSMLERSHTHATGCSQCRHNRSSDRCNHLHDELNCLSLSHKFLLPLPFYFFTFKRWGFRPARLISLSGYIARWLGVTTATIAWLGVLGRLVLTIVFLDVTVVGTGHTLHLFAIAVKTGNLHGSLREFLLQVGVGGEDDSTTRNQSRLYLFHLLYALCAQSESHGAQTRQRY